VKSGHPFIRDSLTRETSPPKHPDNKAAQATKTTDNRRIDQPSCMEIEKENKPINPKSQNTPTHLHLKTTRYRPFPPAIEKQTP
jgi:hypothetical protein